jgi:hypothetical protein
MLGKLLLQLQPRRIQTSVRWNWQGYLTKRFDRATGQYKYDDWERIIMGSQEPTKGGKSLLQRHLNNEEHIKPTEAKRRVSAADGILFAQ